MAAERLRSLLKDITCVRETRRAAGVGAYLTTIVVPTGLEQKLRLALSLLFIEIDRAAAKEAPEGA